MVHPAQDSGRPQKAGLPWKMPLVLNTHVHTSHTCAHAHTAVLSGNKDIGDHDFPLQRTGGSDVQVKGESSLLYFPLFGRTFGPNLSRKWGTLCILGSNILASPTFDSKITQSS